MQDKQPILWKWQHLIPIVVLLFTTSWGLYVGYLKKEQGRIDLALDSISVIASLKDKKNSKLKLLYEDKIITEASALRIYVSNSGNVDLHLKDKTDLYSVEWEAGDRLFMLDVPQPLVR